MAFMASSSWCQLIFFFSVSCCFSDSHISPNCTTYNFFLFIALCWGYNFLIYKTHLCFLKFAHAPPSCDILSPLNCLMYFSSDPAQILPYFLPGPSSLPFWCFLIFVCMALHVDIGITCMRLCSIAIPIPKCLQLARCEGFEYESWIFCIHSIWHTNSLCHSRNSVNTWSLSLLVNACSLSFLIINQREPDKIFFCC